MASGWTNKGLADILDGTIDLDTDTIKIMLVDDDFVFDKDLELIDNGADDSSDPSFHELSATNYTGGYGGAGRKTATITSQANDTDNRADAAIADLTWTALGGASNDTIGGALVVKEISADTSSRVIAFFDLTDTPTNGSDITLDFNSLAAGGNLRIAA